MTRGFRRAFRVSGRTLDLIVEIERLDGVKSVTAIAPNRSAAGVHETRLRITLDGPDGIHSDFTLPEARKWLASEKAEAAR